jgi:membrane-bound lytic murein transglycosylase B
MQRFLIILFALTASFWITGVNAQSLDQEFNAWVQKDLWADAKASGISKRTFQRSMGNVSLNLKLPGLVIPGTKPKTQKQTQAEFRSPSRYFNEKRLLGLAAAGNRLLIKHQKLLSRIEKTYGVPQGILLAIWGRESGFGRASISYSVIDVLATMSYLSPRKAFFQTELLAAMKIVQNGDVPAKNMKSSWAGAMGQPQFMP